MTMWNPDKAIIITNNDRVYEKYKKEMQVILLDSYEDVLIKTRDMVYNRHILLTHPQASSLKPNQTPYRSVVVYPKGEEDLVVGDVFGPCDQLILSFHHDIND